MCVSLESENKQRISISVRLSELISVCDDGSDELLRCLGLRRLQHPMSASAYWCSADGTQGKWWPIIVCTSTTRYQYRVHIGAKM